MEINLKSAKIRNFRPGDEVSLVQHANNKNISKNLLNSFPYPYKYSHASHWIKIAESSDPVMHFAIDVEGKAVGSIGIKPNDDVFANTFEIGYWIGEEFWGMGIIPDAISAFTNYVFDNFTCNRLCAGIFENNYSSIRAIEKCGFQFEGRMRKAVFKDGRFWDEMIYSILKEERK